jgi:hypothetical protein
MLDLGEHLHQLNGLCGYIFCERLMVVNPSEEPNRFVWKLSASGVFTVKSMYEVLMNEHSNFPTKYLWKPKLPLKIKVYMWFLDKKITHNG